MAEHAPLCDIEQRPCQRQELSVLKLDMFRIE
jgi:hypothetical protein